jgi:hypothetical protein
MGWTAGICFPAERRDFFLYGVQTIFADHSAFYPMGINGVQTIFAAHSAFYPVGIKDSFPENKVTGHEADHSPPLGADVESYIYHCHKLLDLISNLI